MMKINSEVLNNPNKTRVFDGPTDKQFEEWLQSPAKQTAGDEYYRQHQTDLQPSELNFEECDLGLNHPTVGWALAQQDHCSNLPVEPRPNLQQAYCANIPVGPRPNLLQQALAQQNYCSNIPVGPSPSLLHPSDSCSNLPNIESKPAVGWALAQQKYRSNNNFVGLSPNLLKNYQLYIHKESAEFSINTQLLPKNEIDNLKKLIRQWLVNKGLILKQLIVNGELQ